MRNCILIIPPFFEYPQIIEKALTGYFDNVYLIYSTPSGFLYKFSSFIQSKGLCRYFLNKQSYSIKKWINKNVKDVEFILIVKASLLSVDLLRWLKFKWPNSKMVQYLWDNISTDPEAISTLTIFDENYSFSPEDCKIYGMRFRPFFFNPVTIPQKKSIDIACIASFSLDRAILLEKILISNQDLNLNNKLFWHIKGSRALFYKYRKYTKYLRPYLRNSSIKYNRMLKIMGQSKAQIDIPNPKQQGLTTRSFESLWTKTKIITTNPNIQKYDFYNETNILILNKDNMTIDKEWLNKPFEDLPAGKIEKYSVDSFVSDLIGLTNNFNSNING